MRSMTGFGRGEASAQGVRFSVELNSVNRKQIDLALNLPRSLHALEGRIREKIQGVVARGRVNATVTISAGSDSAAAEVIDVALAGVYAESMRRLQRQLGLAGELSLETVLRAPGVLLSPGQDTDAESAWPAVEAALQTALNGLVAMRETEGDVLQGDIVERLQTLRNCAGQIAARLPEIGILHRKQLLERIQNAGVDLEMDQDRLLRELALFADRSDVSEELTRLESHFQQMDKLLRQSGAVGRTMEFLTQEIARELNTLSVKSNDAPVSHWVVGAKAELEKIREQIMNIE